MIPFINFKNRLRKGFAKILPENAELLSIKLILKDNNLFAQYNIEILNEVHKSDIEKIEGKEASQLIELAEMIGKKQNLDKIFGYELAANYQDDERKASLHIYGTLKGAKVHKIVKV